MSLSNPHQSCVRCIVENSRTTLPDVAIRSWTLIELNTKRGGVKHLMRSSWNVAVKMELLLTPTVESVIYKLAVPCGDQDIRSCLVLARYRTSLALAIDSFATRNCS